MERFRLFVSNNANLDLSINPKDVWQVSYWKLMGVELSENESTSVRKKALITFLILGSQMIVLPKWFYYRQMICNLSFGNLISHFWPGFDPNVLSDFLYLIFFPKKESVRCNTKNVNYCGEPSINILLLSPYYQGFRQSGTKRETSWDL